MCSTEMEMSQTRTWLGWTWVVGGDVVSSSQALPEVCG